MNKAQAFFAEHNADDILYAVQHPQYFDLTVKEHLALVGLVFKALDKAKEN